MKNTKIIPQSELMIKSRMHKNFISVALFIKVRFSMEMDLCSETAPSSVVTSGIDLNICINA